MHSLTEYIRNFFKRKKKDDLYESLTNNNLLISHLVYNIKDKTASFWIDYDNSLINYKNSPKEHTEALVSNSDHLANFLYSLCNVKGFLPSLIIQDLMSHKEDSEAHNIFINSTLGYLDQIILSNDKVRSLSKKTPVVKPTQVFKNAQS